MKLFFSNAFGAVAGVMSGIQGMLIALAIGLSAGGYIGWYLTSDHYQANQLEAIVEVNKVSVKLQEKSDAIENKAADEKEIVQVKYKTITKEIVKYVPKTRFEECKTPNGDIIDYTLNIGAVRMLNGEPASTDVQSTEQWDEKSQTITEVGLREMSEYIIEIKKQYEELAIDHDSLVDYDTSYKNELNKLSE